MPDEPIEWSVTRFLKYFREVHQLREARAFCFVLGAGASVESKIPSGLQLVDIWLRELQESLDREYGQRDAKVWATAETLGISGFQYDSRDEFYSKIYEYRFQGDRELGHAAIEAAMDGKEPSFGYSVLANILATTQHRVVITTNFDNLVADALAIYTNKFPFVCGHESLTGFIRPRMARPLVAKVHRDLLLAPLSAVDETTKLAKEWVNVLTGIFAHYTPLVIGYGGNDGSFVGFLERLEVDSIRGPLIWCYRNQRPKERIQKLLAKHRGILVCISGFDALMVRLNQELKLGLLGDEVKDRGKRRADLYSEQYDALVKRLAGETHPNASPATTRSDEKNAALQALVSAKSDPNDWSHWVAKARQEGDPDKKEAIYREGLKQLPDSPELSGDFAIFLHYVRKNYEEAEQFYRKAIELDPNNVTFLGSFANFSRDVRKNYDEAEQLYRKAIDLDPNNAIVLVSFANFSRDARKNYDEAEQLYRKAIDLDPNNAVVLGSFATFTRRIRKNYDEAEQFYRKAIELDPNEGNNTSNLATFLKDVRKNYDEAERLFRRAMKLNPNDAVIIANYVELLLETGRIDEAAENAETAWQSIKTKDQRQRAAIAYLQGLIARLKAEDDATSLGRLKTLLLDNYDRLLPWTFDEVLLAVGQKLTSDDRSLYTALAEAINDKDKIAELAAHERWNNIQPLPLDGA